ncbi:alcohol dehydrogenase catalytic domain-containing protein [Xanthomonas fragariae]|uniref:alcohol dehydrogenase catalytic domain-containing protein n=1 Tax=Xanthomonas fragariae TaxID=48664 RepID=UPI003D18943B
MYYPIVPGHEIVGRVIEVGAEVSRYRVGDHVAVGCMIDSCQQCDQCHRGKEQLCREGNTGTYAGGEGGYSKHLVVREEFCLQIPKGLDPTRAQRRCCARASPAIGRCALEMSAPAWAPTSRYSAAAHRLCRCSTWMACW